MSKQRRPSLAWILLVAGLVLLPFVTSGTYVTGVMCFVALYAALACGMGLLMEQADLVDARLSAFFEG